MSKQYKTKNKEILYSYFESMQGRRFCAKDVVEYLAANNISMNQATVYRNIEKLSAEGVLIKTKQPNDENCYFQYVGENSHCQEHLHMQCKKCGKLVHLEDPEMDNFYKKLHEEHGFVLEPCESVLVGVCSDCEHNRENVQNETHTHVHHH